MINPNKIEKCKELYKVINITENSLSGCKEYTLLSESGHEIKDSLYASKCKLVKQNDIVKVSMRFSIFSDRYVLVNMRRVLKDKQCKVKRTYDFYCDAGHGWLKVEIRQLKELNIDNNISAFSYKRGAYAYLEEDLDAGVFISAFKQKYGFKPEFREHNSEHSRIRNYERY